MTKAGAELFSTNSLSILLWSLLWFISFANVLGGSRGKSSAGSVSRSVRSRGFKSNSGEKNRTFSSLDDWVVGLLAVLCVIVVIICICLLCRKVCRGDKHAEGGETDQENIKLTTKNIEVIEEIDEEEEQQQAQPEEDLVASDSSRLK